MPKDTFEAAEAGSVLPAPFGGRSGSARARREARALAGPEKAAILFLCLGEKRGTALMQKLSEADIQTITRAMAGLGSIPAEVVEEVMEEFTYHVTEGGEVYGSFAVAEGMLRGFLPEAQVTQIMNQVRGRRNENRGMWDRFSALNESVIANYLRGEHEQTAAAILTNVAPDVAAKVLPMLGPDKMQEVAERMMTMDAVPLHMMRQIEETLQQEVIGSASRSSGGDTQQRMADLFNKLDREAFDKIAPVLEERHPERFFAIKQRMFTFADLAKLDMQDLARVMRGMEGSMLPLALRGAEKELRDTFLAALPARTRDMLLDEMNTMGPVRGREVRAAQVAMVDLAKDLAEQEVIRLPLDDEDELIE
ncbi:flagellar motor switch protein FliG [Pseudoroseicyclus aestuarii]|nr:FliG C-terminal domain-containing protein [Pseudoroseicyclus aestuarii]